RLRSRDRPAARRSADRVRGLGEGLLRQRSNRPRRVADRSEGGARKSCSRAGAALRRCRCSDGDRGLMLLVYGLTRAPTVGWTSAETIASFAGFAVLIAAAVVIEQRSRSPLVDLRIFRRRTLTAANLI